MQYLWNTYEAKVLRQQGQVGEVNTTFHRLVNWTVAKVHLTEVKLEVWVGHHCLDCELDRLHLNTKTDQAFLWDFFLWLEYFCYNHWRSVFILGLGLGLKHNISYYYYFSIPL